MKVLTVFALAATLTACATAPRPLQGQFSSLLPDAAAQREANGELVRWGGRIVHVEPQRERSCFEIVAKPLSASGRPQNLDRSAGRFIACRNGFYDPEVFQPGRSITVSGRVDGFEIRKVGDFDYRYPRVAADVIYLWPEQRDRELVFARPVFGMSFGGWW